MGLDPTPAPPRESVYRRGYREVHRSKIRIEWNHDGRGYHYQGSPLGSRKTRWLFRADGSGARLQPVRGKTAGDRTTFDDPFIMNTVIQPLR